MAALLYASRLPDSPYDVVLVSGDKADCGGIALAGGQVGCDGRPERRGERVDVAFLLVVQGGLQLGGASEFPRQ